MPTTRMPSNATSRTFRLGGLVAVLGLFAALAQESLLAGATNSFFQNAAMQTQGNYSTGLAPNNTTHVLITTGLTNLSITAATVTAESLSVSNGTTYNIGNRTGGNGNSTLTLGNTAGFNNAYSGVATESALLTVANFLPGNKLQLATGSNSTLLPTVGSLSNENFSFSNGFTTGTEGGYFTIAAIPEPSTYAAAIGLLGLMLWPSRKRLIKDAKRILGFTPPMRDRLAAQRRKA